MGLCSTRSSDISVTFLSVVRVVLSLLPFLHIYHLSALLGCHRYLCVGSVLQVPSLILSSWNRGKSISNRLRSNIDKSVSYM